MPDKIGELLLEALTIAQAEGWNLAFHPGEDGWIQFEQDAGYDSAIPIIYSQAKHKDQRQRYTASLQRLIDDYKAGVRRY